MEDVLLQSKAQANDRKGEVAIDIESLAQLPNKCSGSPKMTKALSRKGSNRMERRNVDDQEIDESAKKIVVKVMCSQLDQLKPSLLPNKSLVTSTTVNHSPIDADCKSKRFSRLLTPRPRKILLAFATMSSIGTMILIYFTLAINRGASA